MKLNVYYWSHYVPYIKAQKAPSTVDGYMRDWTNHIECQWGNYEIYEIRIPLINQWINTFKKPGAARSAYKTLHQIINCAIGDEYYPDDVAEPKWRAVRLPKIESREKPRALSLKEFKELLRALYGWKYEAVVICAMWLGLRRSESCGLQWGDIDLRSGVVTISRGLQVIDREVVVTKVKTKRSKRKNVLPKVAVERLREIKRQLKPASTDWLLGDNPNPEVYARELRKVAKYKGVRCVAPKYLRHSSVTNLHRIGVPDSDIQYMHGHESLSTTTEHYLMLDTEICRRNIKRLEKAVLKA